MIQPIKSLCCYDYSHSVYLNKKGTFTYYRYEKCGTLTHNTMNKDLYRTSNILIIIHHHSASRQLQS